MKGNQTTKPHKPIARFILHKESMNHNSNPPNTQQKKLELEINFEPSKNYIQAFADAQMVLNHLRKNKKQIESYLSGTNSNNDFDDLKEFYNREKITSKDVEENFISKLFKCLILPGNQSEQAVFSLKQLHYEQEHLSIHPLLKILFEESFWNHNSTSNEELFVRFRNEITTTLSNPNSTDHEIFIPRRIVDNMDCDELVYFNYNADENIVTLRYKMDALNYKYSLLERVWKFPYEEKIPVAKDNIIRFESEAGELYSNIMGGEELFPMSLNCVFEHILMIIGTMGNINDLDENTLRGLLIISTPSTNHKIFNVPSITLKNTQSHNPLFIFDLKPIRYRGIHVEAPLHNKTSKLRVEAEIPLKEELHEELNMLSEVINSKEIQNHWKECNFKPEHVVDNHLYGLFDIINRALITNYTVQNTLVEVLKYNGFLDCFPEEFLEQLPKQNYREYLKRYATELFMDRNLSTRLLHYSPCWLAREVSKLERCEITNGVYHLDAEFTGVPVERLRKWLGGIVDLNGDPKGISKIHIQRVN